MNGCFGCYNPWPQQQCFNSNFQQPVGPYPCHPHFPSVRKNFTIPAANSPVIVEFTDTQSLYVGQGLLIGSGYYLITDILDSLRVELQHNGLGATPGTLVIATHPSYGCYQYPVKPVGKVTLTTVPTVVGLNITADGAIASSIASTTTQLLKYGYLGPTTIQFAAEWIGETDNTPYWIGLELPVPANQNAPAPVFSAFYEDGGNSTIAVAKLGNSDYENYIIIGKGGGAAFGDGAARRVSATGIYEIET